MKITGTRDHIKVDNNGKIAWFDGELGIDGFYAEINSMRWLPPYDKIPVTEEELKLLINAVERELSNSKYKVFFN